MNHVRPPVAMDKCSCTGTRAKDRRVQLIGITHRGLVKRELAMLNDVVVWKIGSIVSRVDLLEWDVLVPSRESFARPSGMAREDPLVRGSAARRGATTANAVKRLGPFRRKRKIECRSTDRGLNLARLSRVAF